MSLVCYWSKKNSIINKAFNCERIKCSLSCLFIRKIPHPIFCVKLQNQQKPAANRTHKTNSQLQGIYPNSMTRADWAHTHTHQNQHGVHTVCRLRPHVKLTANNPPPIYLFRDARRVNRFSACLFVRPVGFSHITHIHTRLHNHMFGWPLAPANKPASNRKKNMRSPEWPPPFACTRIYCAGVPWTVCFAGCDVLSPMQIG